MKVYWIVLKGENQAGPGFGITARDWDDAMSLLAEAARAVFAQPANEEMIESWREVRSVDDLDQNHVVPNMGSLLRRGVWFPNVPAIQ
jgi:hypothetical protein